MAKIEDFGEKIGGARKDLYRLDRELRVDDITDWSDIDRDKYITKNEVFPRPDYNKLYADGMDREVLFFIKRVRDALPSKPEIHIQYNATDEEKRSLVHSEQERYIRSIGEIYTRALELKTLSQCENFYTNLQENENISAKYINNRKLSKAANLNNAFSVSLFRRDLAKKQFLYSDSEKKLSKYGIFYYNGSNVQSVEMYGSSKALEIQTGNGSRYYSYITGELGDLNHWRPDTYFALDEKRQVISINAETKQQLQERLLEIENEKASPKSKKKRKVKFIPPQLAHIRPTKQNYRQGKDITVEDMMSVFGFRAGEFGNWETENDKQTNLNMSYEAFKDLASALDISDDDISLGGQLAIAYGSRGIKSAAAHFEPGANVINLTKMNGAGSLGHEWGHALDFYISQTMGYTSIFSSDGSFDKNNITHDLMNAIKYTEDNARTKYLEDAIRLDTNYSKEAHGYWQSNVELFARAFASYVHDKLEESDYLVGHSEAKVDDETYISPQGEERKRINLEFDRLIDKLKEQKVLTRSVDRDLTDLNRIESKELSAQQITDNTPYENEVQIYEVTGNIPEPDRTDENSSIKTYNLDTVKNLVAEITSETSDPLHRQELLEQSLNSKSNDDVKIATLHFTTADLEAYRMDSLEKLRDFALSLGDVCRFDKDNYDLYITTDHINELNAYAKDLELLPADEIIGEIHYIEDGIHVKHFTDEQLFKKSIDDFLENETPIDKVIDKSGKDIWKKKREKHLIDIGSEIDKIILASKVGPNRYNLTGARKEIKSRFRSDEIKSCLAMSVMANCSDPISDKNCVAWAEQYCSEHNISTELSAEDAPCKIQLRFINAFIKKSINPKELYKTAEDLIGNDNVQKEKVTLTVDEKDILLYAEKIQKNIQQDKIFADRLDKFLKSDEKSTDFLYVGKTSNALAVSGANQKLDVVISPKTIVKCMSEATERYHGHGLSQEIMEQLPQGLRNPVMIFKGSFGNSLVVITELKDKEQRGIMVAVSLSEKNKHHIANRIASAYGRNNMTNYLQAQISKGNLIACNKEKANKMLQSAGLQLPLEETFISFDNSIAYTDENVKRGNENFLKDVAATQNEQQDKSVTVTQSEHQDKSVTVTQTEKAEIISFRRFDGKNQANIKRGDKSCWCNIEKNNNDFFLVLDGGNSQKLDDKQVFRLYEFMKNGSKSVKNIKSSVNSIKL